MSKQAEDLSKQLALLKGKLIAFEERLVKAEFEASLLWEKLPKQLDEGATEAVEKFRRSKEFELAAVLWCRSAIISVFKGMSKDILKVDAKFPLDKLPSMRDFLALQVRDAEAKKAAEEEVPRARANPLRWRLLLFRKCCNCYALVI